MQEILQWKKYGNKGFDLKRGLSGVFCKTAAAGQVVFVCNYEPNKDISKVAEEQEAFAECTERNSLTKFKWSENGRRIDYFKDRLW